MFFFSFLFSIETNPDIFVLTDLDLNCGFKVLFIRQRADNNHVRETVFRDVYSVDESWNMKDVCYTIYSDDYSFSTKIPNCFMCLLLESPFLPFLPRT